MAKRAQGGNISLKRSAEVNGLGLRAQVYKSLFDAIVDGKLAPGTRLPSARQLATDWSISRNTIDDATAQLQVEGLVVRRVGDGTFVARDIPRRAVRANPVKMRRPTVLGRKVLASVSAWGSITSSVASPLGRPRPDAFLAGLPALEYFPLELWRRLTARRMRISGRDLLGYFPSMGYLPLREAMARHLATAREVICSPDQIMIVNSTMQAADLIARVLLERGDKAWIEDHSVPNLRAALTVSGAQLIPVPVDEQGLDVRRGIYRAPDAVLVYTTPSCQYPTGVPLASDRRLDLIAWADRAGAWIVEDDYQSEFTYSGRPIAPLHSFDHGKRVLYVGTFTNSMFPSLRLAYMVVPKPLIAVFRAVRSQLDDHTHGLLQTVMADFVGGGYFSAHMRRMRAIYQLRRDALVAACAREMTNAATLGSVRSGMHASLYLPSHISDRKAAESAQRAGVGVLPLSRYAVGSRHLNGLLLGYTALTERRIAAGISRLASVLVRSGAAG
jgi:GntR family transcriptional regulator / MocR family aminotransferase